MPRGIYDHYKIRGKRRPDVVLRNILLKKGNHYAFGKHYKMPVGFEMGNKNAFGHHRNMPENERRSHMKYFGKEREIHFSNLRNRYSFESIKWRDAIFKRDNYTCQLCGATAGLVAHHIRSWVNYPELRFDISNGITLCGGKHIRSVGSCHYFIHFLDFWSSRD
jgi:hypothetical protein